MINAAANPVPPLISAEGDVHPGLASRWRADKIRHVGDPVALVIATSRHRAEDAVGAGRGRLRRAGSGRIGRPGAGTGRRACVGQGRRQPVGTDGGHLRRRRSGFRRRRPGYHQDVRQSPAHQPTDGDPGHSDRGRPRLTPPHRALHLAGSPHDEVDDRGGDGHRVDR